MCGIFALLNNCDGESRFSKDFVQMQFKKGSRRGPEFSVIKNINKVDLGFHRLAINGLNNESNQPIIINDVYLICNGEIYNYVELYKTLGVTPNTNSDCEVIIHLYVRYGFEQMLTMLDGVFALMLCDFRGDTMDSYKIFIARDPFGVRPLYIMLPTYVCKQPIIGVSSEIKSLVEFKSTKEYIPHSLFAATPTYLNIRAFLPGHYQEFKYDFVNSWTVATTSAQVYHRLPFSSINDDYGMDKIYQGIVYHFNNAIKKRYLNTDRPIACLLSGGLDSSSVVASVNELHKQYSGGAPLETYSIGLEGSEDLKNARIVADYLKTKHTEIILTERDFFDAISETIHNIETFDTTTVRASIPNGLLCKKISEISDAKVIFNGDGADELLGGYIYEYKAPDAYAFDADIRRLLTNIYKHDVRRSDGSISSYGLEPRTPFLDRGFVQFILSISPIVRFHVHNNQCEKYLFRKAFSRDYVVNDQGEQLLPDSVLWRRKEAFSDGVSGSQGRSLFQILQEQITAHLNLSTSADDRKNIYMKQFAHLPPTTDEQYYYRTIFDKFFPKCQEIVTDFWMPRFIESTDPSARTLSIYASLNK
jgi:asparagine synthase (glutamine-hydrolysing)